MRAVPAAAAAVLLLVLTGCGSTDEGVAGAASPSGGPTTSQLPTSSEPPATPPTTSRPPCDPGGGFPRPRAGCPETDPETGWLRADPEGRLTLKPFRTYGNDAAGQAYAREHGLEFPFSNDYFDAPTGKPHGLELNTRTVCTGIILVGHEDPLADHVVACKDLVAAAARMRVPVAAWRDGTRVVQLSELYRP